MAVAVAQQTNGQRTLNFHLLIEGEKEDGIEEQCQHYQLVTINYLGHRLGAHMRGYVRQ